MGALPPDADVRVAGDFNGWRPVPMRVVHGDHTHSHASDTDETDDEDDTHATDDADDTHTVAYEASFRLPRGVYQYKFVVDGVWLCSEGSAATVHDSRGLTNHVLHVPPLGHAHAHAHGRGYGHAPARTRTHCLVADADEGEAKLASLQLAALRMAFAVDPRTLGPKGAVASG